MVVNLAKLQVMLAIILILTILWVIKHLNRWGFLLIYWLISINHLQLIIITIYSRYLKLTITKLILLNNNTNLYNRHNKNFYNRHNKNLFHHQNKDQHSHLYHHKRKPHNRYKYNWNPSRTCHNHWNYK